MYCVYNVPVSGTASQYMLLCMHIIAAREVLVLVTAITLLINCSYSFHGGYLERFSQQRTRDKSPDSIAYCCISNRCAYIASV